jgi:hypothetical protein
VATKETASKRGGLPVIPLILAAILVAAYVAIVVVPAFSSAGGMPSNFLSLIWPPALIVLGLTAMLWGRSLLAKKAAEDK